MYGFDEKIYLPSFSGKTKEEKTDLSLLNYTLVLVRITTKMSIVRLYICNELDIKLYEIISL